MVLSKFIANSGNFHRLPYEKQRQFYKVMDDRDQEIDQAFEQAQLNEVEYRAALEAAWLGKHINRFEKYASLPPGAARAAYINTLLNEKEKKDQKKEKDKKGQKKTGDKIKVYETAAELRVESWPPAEREQWNLFHNAYRLEKKAREEKATATPANPR